MKKKNNVEIPFDSIEDMFGIPKEADEYKVTLVPLKNLFAYFNHPFKVVDDEKMDDLVVSIKENGVLEPALVRPRSLGGYEIISGHRRKRACERAEMNSMPVIIKDLSDDEAAIIMVDSNNQRENLLISEKAWAYRIKYEALKHQGKKLERSTMDTIIDDTGKNDRQIRRYIRLTYLQDDLLDMVDKKKIKLNAAEKLSYLSTEMQIILGDLILEKKVYPTAAMAEEMKQYSVENKLNAAMLETILMDRRKKTMNVVISSEIIEKYFPRGSSKEDIEKAIINLLEEYWKRGQIHG